MKKVYTAGNPVDAHLLKGLLKGENIPAEVRGEFLYGARGELPITPDTSPTVWIQDDSDYGRAMELVTAFQGGENINAGEAGIWRCECGEENGNQFTECWSCGRSRPVL